MFALRVSGLLTKTGQFKMAFVRIFGINTELELRTRNKKLLTATCERQRDRWVKDLGQYSVSFLDLTPLLRRSLALAFVLMIHVQCRSLLWAFF